MPVTTTTVEELELRSRLAFDRTTRLLTTTDPNVRLRDSDWTCRDVAVHLLTVLYRYTRRDPTSTSGLGPTVAQVAVNNAADIDANQNLTHAEALDLMRKEFDTFLAMPIALDATFPFHAGQTIDGAGGRANMIGELLLHGRDVAVTVGSPWQLDERDMVLVLNGLLQVAPGWLDRQAAEGKRLDVALRIAGATPQLMHIADGTLEVRDLRDGDRPHAVIKTPAEALALQLYGRISPWQAARRGLRITGGTRPWRGVRLPRLFLPA